MPRRRTALNPSDQLPPHSAKLSVDVAIETGVGSERRRADRGPGGHGTWPEQVNRRSRVMVDWPCGTAPRLPHVRPSLAEWSRVACITERTKSRGAPQSRGAKWGVNEEIVDSRRYWCRRRRRSSTEVREGSARGRRGEGRSCKQNDWSCSEDDDDGAACLTSPAARRHALLVTRTTTTVARQAAIRPPCLSVTQQHAGQLTAADTGKRQSQTIYRRSAASRGWVGFEPVNRVQDSRTDTVSVWIIVHVSAASVALHADGEIRFAVFFRSLFWSSACWLSVVSRQQSRGENESQDFYSNVNM